MSHDDGGRKARRGSLTNLSNNGSSSSTKVTDHTLAMAAAAAEAKSRAKALQAARAEAAAEAEAQAKAIAEAQLQATIAQKDLEIAELQAAVSQMIDKDAYDDLSTRLETWQRYSLALMERFFKDSKARTRGLDGVFSGPLSVNLNTILCRDASDEIETRRTLLDIGADGILLRWVHYHVPELPSMLAAPRDKDESAGMRRALRKGMGIDIDDDIDGDAAGEPQLPEAITDGLLANEEIYVRLLKCLRRAAQQSPRAQGSTLHKDDSEEVALEASFDESLNLGAVGKQMDSLEKAKRLIGAVSTLSGMLPPTAMAGEGLSPALRGCIPSVVERILTSTQDFNLASPRDQRESFFSGAEGHRVAAREVLKRVAKAITADDLAKGSAAAHRLLLFSLFLACPAMVDERAVKQIEGIEGSVASLLRLYDVRELPSCDSLIAFYYLYLSFSAFLLSFWFRVFACEGPY